MVEAMAVCPTYYGRFNLTADPAGFLRTQKERAVPADRFDEGETRSHDRYPVGLLHHREREEYVSALRGVRERAQEQHDG
jgi:hypothetical protein